MSVNRLSVGVNFTLHIQTQRGPLIFPTVTSFDLRSRSKMQESIPINRPPIFLSIPGGFAGTIELDRMNDALEAYWTEYEKDYYKGIDIVSSTIIATFTETGGNINQYALIGVAFDAPDFGRWTGETYVKQKMDFYASEWIKQ